ncbi:MAG: biopolymer transporter ExbD [Candidatus Omnitrophica bacterium]|nr:biopolymer transporter ExbD [Candidatus Omnitrophota bacterium]
MKELTFKRHHIELEHGLRQIDLAPLIDIVFQLLIFFMLTSSFALQPAIKINLPPAHTGKIMESQSLEIVVSRQNVIYVNGKVVTLKELKHKLRQFASKDRVLLIKSDRRARLGRIVEIWDLCRQLGFTKLNLATEQQ